VSRSRTDVCGRWIALLVCGLIGCRGESAAGPVGSDVAAEFAAICDRFRESEDPFYGELTARRLEARLAAIERGQEAAPPQRVERVVLALANEWIELGRTDDALALLERTKESAVELEGAPPDAPRAPAADVAAAEDPRILRLNTELAARLQAAEDLNCLMNHSAASCILPF